ncbi:MAG: ABC transporter ATP-binding protein [Gammaproteobacteria bacterium]|nr:ABC transporter ATP-binding protein [Gammaproteobacteria bacterium]
MRSAEECELSCHALDVSVPGRLLVRGLELSIAPGNFIAVLGQNGTGKSLTLHTLAGLRPYAGGRIRLCGEDIGKTRRTTIAQHLALLPQYTEDIFPATVFDTVMIGRHPHVGRFNLESDEDRRIARAALAELDLDELSSRDVLTLSGGERRRLAIAQILTQSPQLYLLDEPTNHLDPQHQLQVLQMFRNKALQGAGVLASLHDVNLAARYADSCLLLYGDGRWELGLTADILSEDRLTELYETPIESLSWRNHQLFVATGG